MIARGRRARRIALYGETFQLGLAGADSSAVLCAIEARTEPAS